MANETTARQFLFSILIFGALIAGAFSLIASFLPTETHGNFTEFNQTYNKFDEIKTESSATAKQIEEGEPAKGIAGILNGLIDASWGSLKLIFNSFGTLSTIISDISAGTLGFNIPVWFSGLLITIVFITIAFALMAAWFKWHI